jgi:hypothetical protein
MLRFHQVSFLCLRGSNLNCIFYNLEYMWVIPVEIVGSKLVNLEELSKAIKMIGLMEVVSKHSRYLLILKQHPKFPEQFKIPENSLSFHICEPVLEVHPRFDPKLRMSLNEPSAIALVKHLEEPLVLIHVCLLHEPHESLDDLLPVEVLVNRLESPQEFHYVAHREDLQL